MLFRSHARALSGDAAAAERGVRAVGAGPCEEAGVGAQGVGGEEGPGVAAVGRDKPYIAAHVLTPATRQPPAWPSIFSTLKDMVLR